MASSRATSSVARTVLAPCATNSQFRLVPALPLVAMCTSHRSGGLTAPGLHASEACVALRSSCRLHPTWGQVMGERSFGAARIIHTGPTSPLQLLAAFWRRSPGARSAVCIQTLVAVVQHGREISAFTHAAPSQKLIVLGARYGPVRLGTVIAATVSESTPATGVHARQARPGMVCLMPPPSMALSGAATRQALRC